MPEYRINPINISFDPSEFLGAYGDRGPRSHDIPLSRELDLLTREMVDDAANFAHDRILEHAPFSTGNLHSAVYSKDVVKKSATGVYEAEAGVNPNIAPYGNIVEEGSRNIQSSEGNIMMILKDPDVGQDDPDNVVFTTKRKGQEGQRFVEKASIETDQFIEARMAILRAEYEAYVATFN